MTNWEDFDGDESVERTIPRDRWGRPLIKPVGGGKPRAYTRVTTFADTLEDRFGLERWQQRMVALGLAARKDLLLQVAAHNTESDEDKQTLNGLCEDAKQAAGSLAAANTGTALHRLCERVDRGALAIDDAPEVAQADLRAYAAAMAPLRVVDVERFVVLDELLVAGTFDRTVEFDGVTYAADIKTGSLEYGVTKIAAQIALYSRGQGYDPATGERVGLDVNQRAGLIIHLPAGRGRCDLYWINLTAGWDAVLHSQWVRHWRKRKDLMSQAQFGEAVLEPVRPRVSPSTTTDMRAATVAMDGYEAVNQAAAELDAQAILTQTLGATRVPAKQQIAEATTVHALELAWVEYADEWTDELTAAAVVRKAELTAPVLPEVPAPGPDTISASIKRARSVESLERLWADNQDRWTADHTALAKARRHALSLRTLASTSP